jgi:hypothetical protein
MAQPSRRQIVAEKILFIIKKLMVNRVFCFHGFLGNLGILATSCHVLSRRIPSPIKADIIYIPSPPKGERVRVRGQANL